MLPTTPFPPTRITRGFSPGVDPRTCAVQHADEEVALEACEFWGAYCEAELDNAQLRPFLPQVGLPKAPAKVFGVSSSGLQLMH